MRNLSSFSTLLALLSLSMMGCPGSDAQTDDTIHVDQDDPQDDPQADPNEAGGGDNLVIGDDACETDEDCVPAECCHAAACVGADNAPNCQDAMCTMDCQFGTLDCGGRCLCHEGRCSAQLSEMPQLQVNGEAVEPE